MKRVVLVLLLSVSFLGRAASLLAEQSAASTNPAENPWVNANYFYAALVSLCLIVGGYVLYLWREERQIAREIAAIEGRGES
ncbi:MAG: hypothetical protein D6795_04170 [Deltaproteobacteria bacterium]|nr:MAG: hypothetical protein D6795_04170 [Deltaproteobacteria bacterium]